jgi:hypothetical protein
MATFHDPCLSSSHFLRGLSTKSVCAFLSLIKAACPAHNWPYLIPQTVVGDLCISQNFLLSFALCTINWPLPSFVLDPYIFLEIFLQTQLIFIPQSNTLFHIHIKHIIILCILIFSIVWRYWNSKTFANCVQKVLDWVSKMLKIRIYRIILPVILYGDEMWSPSLREGHKVKMFENKLLRKIFRPKMDEVSEQCKILHNKKFHDLYKSPSMLG